MSKPQIGTDEQGRRILLGTSRLRSTRPSQSAGTSDVSKPPDNNGPSKPKCKKTANHRFAVLNSFVDCSMAGLSKGELATWLILYRDTRNGTACTSQADIARRAGLTVRGIQKVMSKLYKSGLIVRVYTGGLNRGPSRYRVVPLTSQGV